MWAILMGLLGLLVLLGIPVLIGCCIHKGATPSNSHRLVNPDRPLYLPVTVQTVNSYHDRPRRGDSASR